MLAAALLFLPALIAQEPESVPLGLVEVAPGVHVLKGVPTEELIGELKRMRITYVLDFRRDEEMAGDLSAENAQLTAIGATYIRYALGRVPPAADFTFIRGILRDLPRGARILLHCSNGNRAAAAVCPWLVRDRGMAEDTALALCRRAGLSIPETEAAVRGYLKAQVKS